MKSVFWLKKKIENDIIKPFFSHLIITIYLGIYLWNAPRYFETPHIVGPTNTFFRQKNPANGRQSISWPMRIVAPIPKHPASKAKFVENLTFFAQQFYTLYEQKYSNLRPLLSELLHLLWSMNSTNLDSTTSNLQPSLSTTLTFNNP